MPHPTPELTAAALQPWRDLEARASAAAAPKLRLSAARFITALTCFFQSEEARALAYLNQSRLLSAASQNAGEVVQGAQDFADAQLGLLDALVQDGYAPAEPLLAAALAGAGLPPAPARTLN